MGKGRIIGEKIKALREEKNISIKDLAAEAELTEDQLFSVENDGVSLSIAPLVKIARKLDVRLSAFLDDSDATGPVVCRKDICDDKPNTIESQKKHMTYFSLAGNKSGRQMEPFIINIEPSVQKDFILSSHQGEEFLYVLDGAVEINYGEDVFVLEEGDSIFYDSVVEHHVHGDSLKGAKILAVVYSPE